MSCNPAHGGSTPDVEDLQLGRLLAAEGRLLQAADAFASALEARPTNRSAAFHLGAALLVSGKYARALAVLERADRGPAVIGTSAARGLALLALGREEEAWVHLDRAAGGDAEELLAPLLESWAWLEDPAWRFSELLRVLPGCCGPLARASRLLAARGDLEGVRGCLQAIRELSPEDPRADAALEALEPVEETWRQAA